MLDADPIIILGLLVVIFLASMAWSAGAWAWSKLSDGKVCCSRLSDRAWAALDGLFMKARFWVAMLDLAVWLTNRASAFYVWVWRHAQQYDGAVHIDIGPSATTLERLTDE